MAITYLKENLQGEYKEAYERIELYTMTIRMEEDVMDEMMMNLLDILLTAQKDEKPVEKILGKDIGKFCEDYFQTCDRKERLKSVAKEIYIDARWIFIWGILDLLILGEKENSIFDIKTNVATYLCILAMCGVFRVLDKLLGRRYAFKAKRVNTTAYVLTALGACAIFLFLGITWSMNLELTVPLFGVLLLTGGYMAGYLLVQTVYRYRNNGSIRKKENPYKEAEKEVEKEAERQYFIKLYVESNVKQYHRINQRLARKGKEQMSPEGFMEKLWKERKKANKVRKIMDGGMIVFLILVTAFVAKDSTLMDTIIFGCIMVGIFVLYCMINRFMDFVSYYAVQEEILEECDQRGITILELGKELEGKG